MKFAFKTILPLCLAVVPGAALAQTRCITHLSRQGPSQAYCVDPYHPGNIYPSLMGLITQQNSYSVKLDPDQPYYEETQPVAVVSLDDPTTSPGSYTYWRWSGATALGTMWDQWSGRTYALFGPISSDSEAYSEMIGGSGGGGITCITPDTDCHPSYNPHATNRGLLPNGVAASYEHVLATEPMRSDNYAYDPQAGESLATVEQSRAMRHDEKLAAALKATTLRYVVLVPLAQQNAYSIYIGAQPLGEAYDAARNIYAVFGPVREKTQ